MPSAENIEPFFEEWTRQLERGNYVTPEQICKDCPELAPVLEARIQASPWMGNTMKTVAYESDGITESVTFDDSAPTNDDTLFNVGRYEQFRYLTKGGLGEIFIARDEEFGRDVILKFIRRSREANPNNQVRFRVEGKIAARLEHPGVVPIYGMGQATDGRQFLVMRLINGEPFSDAIRQFHQNSETSYVADTKGVHLRQLLGRFVSVCNTIAYSNNRCVLHRDIKPDNILLGRYNETLVVDWGIAVIIERDDDAMATGESTFFVHPEETWTKKKAEVIGTPGYMSPEQAKGDVDLTPASDVFSLGATLYELLTGVRPFQGSSAREVLHRTKTADLINPRRLNPQIPAALDSICLRALQHEPHHRYGTAKDLADDVERWLSNQPVHAHPESTIRQCQRWLRKHQSLAQAVAMATLTVVIVVTVWLTMAWNHRGNLLTQRMDGLRARCKLEETLLKTAVESLKQDVKLLSNRPQLLHLTDLLQNAKVTENSKQSVEAVFHEFLGLNPSYMQARLIAANGDEIVRVERQRPNGMTLVAQTSNKLGRPYFTNTMTLPAGSVYISDAELNVENGQKQWDFPVIRAGVPIYRGADKSVAIVVINLHFQFLTEIISSSELGELLVYLTNANGDFLYHPQPEVAFCFEHGLQYRIDEIFPQLAGSVLPGSASEFSSIKVTPRSAFVITADSLKRSKTSIVEVTQKLQRKYPDAEIRMSTDKQVAAVFPDESASVDEMITAVHGSPLGGADRHAIPSANSCAVFAKKVILDSRTPDRFVLLMIADKR